MGDKRKMYSVENTPIKKIQNDTFILYLIFLISGILFSVTKNSFLGSVSVLLICVAVLLRPAEENFYFIFGLQFVRVIIPLSLGSSAYGLVLPVYAVLTLKYLIKYKYFDIEQILLLMILILDISVSAASGIFKIGDNISWIFSFLYVIFALKKYADKIDFERLFVFFLLAQWTICLVNIIAELQIFGRSLIPSMYGVYTKELGDFAFGKAYSSIAGGNGIGFNNSLAVALCIIMLPRAKSVLLKLFYIVSLVFLGYCGALAISRGFYVELAIFLALVLLSSAKSSFRLAVYTILIGLIVGIVYIAAHNDIFVVIERVLVRFERGNANREELIASALRLLRNNAFVLFFGAGTYYPDVYGFTAHNIYFDSVVSLGIIGGIVYWGIILYTIFSSVKRNGRLTLFGAIPLIMLFSYKFISGSTRDVGFYYYIAMGVLFVIYISNEKRNSGGKTNVQESNNYINAGF